MTWIREGECCRCGECCVGDSGYEPMPRPAAVPGMCPLFRREPDGLGTCTDRQNPYYLGGCIAWPSDPDHVKDFAGCSYTWRWEE